MMKKILVISGLVGASLIAAGLYTLKQESAVSHVAHKEKEWTAEEVREWYSKKTNNLPVEAVENITDEMIAEFIASTKAKGEQVEAPGTVETRITERLTVLSPDVSEAEMDDQAKSYKLEYALCHLDSPTLNLLKAEYREDFTTVLNDLGVEQQCESGLCGYAVEQGALLQLAGHYGVQRGDRILAINGIPLSDMDSFQAFHDSLLAGQQSVQLQLERDGIVQDAQPLRCESSNA